jgi:hypothetical protein
MPVRSPTTTPTTNLSFSPATQDPTAPFTDLDFTMRQMNSSGEVVQALQRANELVKESLQGFENADSLTPKNNQETLESTTQTQLDRDRIFSKLQSLQDRSIFSTSLTGPKTQQPRRPACFRFFLQIFVTFLHACILLPMRIFAEFFLWLTAQPVPGTRWTLRANSAFAQQAELRLRELCRWPCMWLWMQREWKNDAFASSTNVLFWGLVARVGVDVACGWLGGWVLSSQGSGVFECVALAGKVSAFGCNDGYHLLVDGASGWVEN